MKPRNPLQGVLEPQVQSVQPQQNPLQNEPYGLQSENISEQQLNKQLGTFKPTVPAEKPETKPIEGTWFGADISGQKAQETKAQETFKVDAWDYGKQSQREPEKTVSHFGAEIGVPEVGSDDFNYGMEVYENTIKQFADIPHQVVSYGAMAISKITDANELPFIGAIAKSLGFDLNKASDALIQKYGAQVVQYDIFEDKRMEIEEKYKNRDVSDFGRFSTDVLNGALDMIPQVVMAWGSGGTSSLAFMFLRTASRSTEEALQEMEADRFYNEDFKGLTDEQMTDRALAYGTVSGAIEVGTEMIMGGFAGAPKGAFSKGIGDRAQDMVQKMFKDFIMKNEIAEQAIKYGFRFIGEGFEEYLSEVLGTYANLLYKKQGVETDFLKVIGSEQAKDAFIKGIFTSLVMDGVNIGAVKVIDAYAYEQSKRFDEMQPEERLDYARKLLARSGSKIIVADTYDTVDKDGVLKTVNVAEMAEGAYEEATKTIIIPTEVYQSKNVITVSLMHEFTHTLEQSGMYKDFRSSVVNYLKQNGMYDTMRSITEAKYSDIEDTDVDGEIVATFVQDTFFKRIIKTSEGFKRVSDFSALNGVLRSMGKQKVISMKNMFKSFVYQNYYEDMESQPEKLNDMIDKHNRFLEELKTVETPEQYLLLAKELSELQKEIIELQSTINAYHNNHYLASLEASFTAMADMVEKQLDSMEANQNLEVQKNAMRSLAQEEAPETVTKNGIKFQIALSNDYKSYQSDEFKRIPVTNNSRINAKIAEVKVSEVAMQKKVVTIQKVFGINEAQMKVAYDFFKNQEEDPSDFLEKGIWMKFEKENPEFKGIFSDPNYSANRATLIANFAVSVGNVKKSYSALEKVLKEIKDFSLYKETDLDKLIKNYEDGRVYDKLSEELAEEYTLLMELAEKNIDISKFEKEKELVAVHGISVTKLMKAVELGGFASPSIAITSLDEPSLEFGDVLMIMNPSVLEGSRTFGIDAYTPRVPETQLAIEDKEKAKKFIEKVAKKIKSMSYKDRRESKSLSYVQKGLDRTFTEEEYQLWYDGDVDTFAKAFEFILTNKDSKLVANFETFIAENKNMFYDYLGITEEQVLRTYDFSDLMKDVKSEMLQNGFMDAIYFKKSFHKATLENYVLAINSYGDIVGGEAGEFDSQFFLNTNVAKAYMTPLMKTVEEVSARKPFIGKMYDENYSMYNQAFFETIEVLHKYSSSSQTFNVSLKKFLKEKGLSFTQQELEKHLIDSKVTTKKTLDEENYYLSGLTNAEALYRILQKIKNNFEMYIESKPSRAVRFEEVALALIPSGYNIPKMVNALDSVGLKYEFVNASMRTSMKDVLKQKADELGYVKFMLKNQSEDVEGAKLSKKQLEFFDGTKAVEGGKLKTYTILTQDGEKKVYYKTKYPLDIRRHESAQFVQGLSASDINFDVEKLPNKETAMKIMSFVVENGYLYDAVAYEEDGQSGYITLYPYQVQEISEKNPKEERPLQFMLREIRSKGGDGLLGIRPSTIRLFKQNFDAGFDGSEESKRMVMDYIAQRISEFNPETNAQLDAYPERKREIVKKYQIESETILDFFNRYNPELPADSLGYNLSKMQQDYFDNSVVRDDLGNLLRVYHGTQSLKPFSFFDITKSRSGLYGRGFYFSDELWVSAQYVDERNLIEEYYLNIKNPIRANQKTIKNDQVSKIMATFINRYRKALKKELESNEASTLASWVVEDAIKNKEFGIDLLWDYYFPTGVEKMQDIFIVDNIVASLSNAISGELDLNFTSNERVLNYYKHMLEVNNAIQEGTEERDISEYDLFLFRNDFNDSMRVLMEEMYRSVIEVTGYDGYMGEHFVAWLPEQVKVFDNRYPKNSKQFDDKGYAPDGRIRYMVKTEAEYGEAIMKLAKDYTNWNTYFNRVSSLDDETVKAKYPAFINENGLVDYDQVRSSWEMARLKDTEGIFEVKSESGSSTSKASQIIKASSIYQKLKNWVNTNDSLGKAEMFESIIGNKTLRSAMLTMFYLNYKAYKLDEYSRMPSGVVKEEIKQIESLTFEKFINSEMTLYRGQPNDRKLIYIDRIVSYTPDFNISDSFVDENGVIDSIRIKPLMTLGAFSSLVDLHESRKNDFGFAHEVEIFVPRTVVREVSKNLKYQMKDNKGRELTPEQSEFFKDVSRHMKDKDGNLITVYHGSDYAGFLVPENYTARKEFNSGTMYLSNIFSHASTYIRHNPQQYEPMQIDGRERLVATNYSPRTFDATKVKKNIFTDMESMENIDDLEKIGKEFVKQTEQIENKFYNSREITVSVSNKYLSENNGWRTWFDSYHPITIDGEEFGNFERVPLSKIKQVFSELQKNAKETEGDKYVPKKLSFTFNGRMAYLDSEQNRILNKYTINEKGTVLFKNKKAKIEDIIHEVKMAGFLKYLNLGDVYEGYARIRKPLVIPANGANWNKIKLLNSEVANDENIENFISFYKYVNGKQDIYTTNDLVIYATELKNKGIIDSDSIIFMDVIDNGGGWSSSNFRMTKANDYVLLENGMFKDKTNNKPSNDPNIKFMVKEQFRVFKSKQDIIASEQKNFDEYMKVKTLSVNNIYDSKIARKIVHDDYGGNFKLSYVQKEELLTKTLNHPSLSSVKDSEGYIYKGYAKYIEAVQYLEGIDEHIEQINQIIDDISEYFPQAKYQARTSGMAISVYIDEIPVDMYYDVLRSVNMHKGKFIVNQIINKQMLDYMGQKTFQLRIGYHNYVTEESFQKGNWEEFEKDLKSANLLAPQLEKKYADMNVILNKIPSHSTMKYMLSEETLQKLNIGRVSSIAIQKAGKELFLVKNFGGQENEELFLTKDRLEQIFGTYATKKLIRIAKFGRLTTVTRKQLESDGKIVLTEKEKEGINAVVKSAYAPKESIRYAGFVLTDGAMIEVDGYHSDVSGMFDMTVEEFVSIGNIRVRENGLEFGVTEPTQEQYENLIEAVNGNQEYYMAKQSRIFIDVVKPATEGEELYTRESAEFDLRLGAEAVVDLMKDYYKNGEFWEEAKVKRSFLQFSLKSGYQKAKERLSVEKDGTYDFYTGEKISYPEGFQFSFEQNGVTYSDEIFDKKVNETIKRTGSKLHLGYYGKKEVSFRTKILGLAIQIAQQYDQISVWDFSANNGEGAEIKKASYKKALEAFAKERPETYSYWRERRDNTVVAEANDTYDFETKESVPFDSGYQFSFERPKDDYTGWEFDSIVENLIEITGDKAYLGRFGNREVSFHTNNLELAIDMAQRYNQVSVWDFANGTEIPQKDYNKILKQIEKSKEVSTGKTMNEVKDEFDEEIETKTRRHPITTAMSGNVNAKIVKTIEQEIDDGELEYIPASDAEAIKHANARIGSNPNKAFNEFKALYDSGKRIKKNDIATAEVLIQIYSAKRNTKKAMELITMVAELATELGQSVQALSLIKRTSPQGKKMAIEKAVARLKAKYFEMGKTLDIKLNPALVEDLLTKTSIEEMDAVVDKIKQDIADQMPTTFMDKMNAWRYLSMLGNPRTHIRNLVGNGTFWVMNKMKDTIATGIEKVFVEESKRTKAVMVSKETRAFASNMFEDVRDEITSSGKYDIGHDIESLKKVFDPEWLESLRKFNFKALEAEDTIFMRWAFIESLGQYMQARGIDPKNVTPKQIEMAKRHAIIEARKRTFRQASELANTLNHIERTNKVASFFVASTIPFKKTPINIMKSGFEFSPAGLIVNSIKGAVDVKRGKFNATQFIDQISAGLTGTSIALLGAWFYSMGLISGGEDDEETAKMRTYNRQLGAQPYSLNLFGTNVSLDWLTPAVMPFIIGAEIEKVFEQGLNGSLVNEVPEALVSIFDPAFELTMLQGITSTLQSYNDSGAGVAGEVISQATANYITQFAPTLLAQVARIVDPTARTTYAPSDSEYNQFAESTVRKILNKIPYANQLNQPVINIKGEEVKGDPNIMVRALQNLLNPANIKPSISDSTDEEIKRLYSLTGKSSLIPAVAPKSFSYEGENFILSGTEFTKFGKTLGQKSYEIVSSLIGTSAYKSMSNEQKADAVSDALEYASALAKSEMLSGRGIDYDESVIRKVSEAKDAGINTNDYLLMKSKFDTIKSSEDNSKKQNIIMYLIRSGKSDEQIERYLVYVGGYEFLDSDKKFISVLRRFR
jgi:hypothetical protein